MTSVSEQSLEESFRQGFETAVAQAKSFELEPVDLEVLGRERRIRLLGEVLFDPIQKWHEYETLSEMNSTLDPESWPAVGCAYEILSELEEDIEPELRQIISKRLSESHALVGMDLMYLSLEQIIDNKHAWLSPALLDSKEVLRRLLRKDFKLEGEGFENEWGGKFEGEELGKLLGKFIPHFPQNAAQIFEEAPIRGGKYLGFLIRAIKHGAASLEEAIRLYERYVDEEHIYYGTSGSNSEILGEFSDVIISGAGDAQQVLDLFARRIEKGEPSNLDKIAHLIEGGYVDSSAVIELCKKEIQSIPKERFPASGGLSRTLRALAKTVPAGTPAEEIISLYETCFEDEEYVIRVMNAASALDALVELIPLGFVTEQKVIELFETALKQKDEHAVIASRVVNSLGAYAELAAKGLANGDEVARLYAIAADKGTNALKDKDKSLGKLAKLVESGNVDANKVMGIYRIAERHRDSSSGSTYTVQNFKSQIARTVASGKTSFEQALELCTRGMPAGLSDLADAIPSGNVNVPVLLLAIREGISAGRGSYFEGAESAVSHLAKAIPSGKIDSSEVADIYKMLIRKREGSRSGLLLGLDELVKAIPSGKIDPDEVVSVYELAIDSEGINSSSALRTMKDLIESSEHGVRLDDIVRLMHKAIENSDSIYSNLEAFDAFAGLLGKGQMSEEKAREVFDHLYEKHSAYIFGAVGKLAEYLPDYAIGLCKKAAGLQRGIIKGERNLNYHKLYQDFLGLWRKTKKEDYLCLSLCFLAEHKRLKKINEIFRSEERKRRPVSNGERISKSVLEKYAHLQPYERDEITEILIKTPYEFAREHDKLSLPGGWTSKAILDLADDVVKVATIEQNIGEKRVYSLKPKLEVFGKFMAEQRGDIIELDDGNSLLIVGNLKKRDPAWIYANTLYEQLSGGKKVPWRSKHKGYNEAMFNMFLLGIAHKELTQAAHKGAADFPDIKYAPKDGGLHVDAIKRPLPATSMKVYREHMMPVPDRLIEESRRRVRAFRDYADSHSSKSVILGDNKIRENSINGYMYDFAMTGWGLEIEDIIYGLTEPDMGFCSEDKPIDRNLIKHFVSEYIRMRCMHDEKFVSDVLRGKDREMLAVTDDAILHALSVYASCTRKRVQQMENGSIIPRRNYFIRAMQYMLDNGEFATSN